MKLSDWYDELKKFNWCYDRSDCSITYYNGKIELDKLSHKAFSLGDSYLELFVKFKQEFSKSCPNYDNLPLRPVD